MSKSKRFANQPTNVTLEMSREAFVNLSPDLAGIYAI